MTAITIRDYDPKDRQAVRRICYDTAFMGDSIAPQYADFESFADMFSGYYTDVEPESALVAVMDGEVVGYALSAMDSRRAWDPMRVAVRHALTRGACFRPGTFGFYVRAVLDTFADLGKNKRPKIDLDAYPSHVHINLLPQARKGRTGRELMFRAFDRLTERGSPGAHGESLSINTITLNFWQRTLGVRIVGEPYPIPGMRGPGGERLSAVIGLRELTNWDVGAWKQQEEERERRRQQAS